MGSYLKFDNKENNSKSISFAMADFIKEVLPDVERNEYGWRLNKKHVVLLLGFTNWLLEDDENLKNYAEKHKDRYSFKQDFEDIKDDVREVHNCFLDTLTEMIIDKKKWIRAVWVG